MTSTQGTTAVARPAELGIGARFSVHPHTQLGTVVPHVTTHLTVSVGSPGA